MKSTFEVLMREYELVVKRLDDLGNRRVLVLFGGFVFFGALVIYILSQQLQPIVTWIAPLSFVPFFAYLIFNTYAFTASVWIARILALRINNIVGERVLTRFELDVPETQFFGTKQGNIKLWFVHILLHFCIFILFAIVLIISFIKIYYETNHLQGILFFLFYFIVICIFLYASSSFLADLPATYRPFLKPFPNEEPIPINVPTAKPSSSGSSIEYIFASIIPRANDVVRKGFYFVYGFSTAIVIYGLQLHQLQQINFLFRTSTDWTLATVPVWAVCALGIIYFIVEEILLQQAKLIWDDIRHVDTDKEVEKNKTRPIAKGIISIPTAKKQMFVRCISALFLGYVLGGFPLLTIFLVIILHEAIYLLGAKPIRDKYPLMQLLVLSPNLALRFLAGVVSIVGFQLTLIPITVPFVVLCFYSMGSCAAMWRMEGQYYQEKKQDISTISPQDKFYMQPQGRFLQHLGLLGSVLLSGFLVLFYYLDQNFRLTVIFSNTYINNILLAIPFIIVISIITVIIAIPLIFVYRTAIILLNKSKIFTRIKWLLIITLYIFTYILFYISLVYKNIIVLFFSLFTFTLYLLITFEGMTYSQFNYKNLREKVFLVLKCWNAYLFDASTKLCFRKLLRDHAEITTQTKQE